MTFGAAIIPLWLLLAQEAVIPSPATAPTSQPVTGESPAAESADKRSIPSAAAQAKARQELRKQLKLEFSRIDAGGTQSDAPAERLRLASILLARGQQPLLEPAERYVALTESRDLSVAAADAAGALAAATALIAHFDLPPGPTLVSALTLADRQATAPALAKSSAHQAIKLSRQLEDLPDYPSARRAADVAEQAAARAGDLDLQKSAVLRANELRESARLATAYESARKQLETDPMHAQANRAAGEYLCFVRGQWSRGLLHLSRADNPTLRAAAEADLAASSPADYLTAADAWHTYLQNAPNNQKQKLLIHTRGLYELAYPAASSDARQRAAARIIESLATTGSGPAWCMDGELLRSRVGDEVADWQTAIRPGEFSVRTDDFTTVYSRAMVALEGDGTIAPPSDDKLTYRLLLLCTDAAGRTSVLERAGNVQFSSDGKTMRTPGPRNADIRRANGDSPAPQDAHLTISYNGQPLWQSVWKAPPTKAWWLDGPTR